MITSDSRQKEKGKGKEKARQVVEKFCSVLF
jgi:hypothetical protein